jgi:hypothetical protein
VGNNSVLGYDREAHCKFLMQLVIFLFIKNIRDLVNWF